MDATHTDASLPEGKQHAAGRRPGRGIAVAAFALVILVVAAWAIRAATRPHVSDEPLMVIATIPDFSLTERSGRTVTKADLLGKVWLADFVFTSCTGPCPELTLRMRSIQSGIRDEGYDAKLVTFSVDPETDTPKVLQRYADRFGADADRWWFLTGVSQDEMHKLIKTGFLQAVSPAEAGAPLIHSTRLVLVDQRGRIRAWYDGLDPASKPQVLHDIGRLLSEPAGP